MNIPAHNENVRVEDLVRLNDALRKSSTDFGQVGYQTGAVTSGADNGPLSPLVPQSIEGSLASATHTMSELALWPMMPKSNVSSTLHEYTVINEHGYDLDPFIGEGGGGENDFATNISQYERKSVRIKYMAERRQISDVASLVGMIGDNRSAIAEETMRGTMNLMRKVERQMFYGREALNSKGFDGIIQQVRDGAPENVIDAKGSTPTPLLLQEALGEAYSSPNFGRPDCIYVEPRMHAELIKQSVESGRHDQFQVSQSGSLTFGSSQLSIMAPYGPVPVKAAPFLHFASRLPAGGHGKNAPAKPGTAVAARAESVAGSSQFLAGDPVYKYRVQAVGAAGISPLSDAVQENVNTDEEAVLTIADHGINAGDIDEPLYYRIYRTSGNGADSSYRLIAEVPAVPEGNPTLFVDLDDGNNGQKYGCSPIVFAQHDPQVMEFVRLLDFIRRPLAETASIKPFLLMLFGSPIVKVPSKMFLLDNCGVSDTDNFRA